jgi:hypothetical protein
MKRITPSLIALAIVAATMAQQTGQAYQEPTPVFVTQIPDGYRDWKLVSVAHEAGNLNDIRAILGNDLAINAYREGKPFPEGAIIGRLARPVRREQQSLWARTVVCSG